MRTATQMIFYKSASVALEGTASGADYQWPGTALSANTVKFYGDLLVGGSLVWAYWVLVWNPRVTDPVGFSPTSVRLVDFDDGPANLNEIARIVSPPGQLSQNPRVDSVNVIGRLNGLITSASRKNLGHQTYGNGSNGCLIYGSWLELVWS